jgi:hypothetical protein
MLVSDDLTYAEVMALLAPVEKKLGRTINPTLYTLKEFAERRDSKQNFLKRVLEQPVLWLAGNDSMNGSKDKPKEGRNGRAG